MSIGRDQREPSVTMRPAPVLGGLEPQLLSEDRLDEEAAAGARAAAYVPEWTGRGPDDAGVAIVKVQAMLAATVHTRLNRLPRRLALDHLRTAGVRPLVATPAEAVGAIEIADGAGAPVEVAEGSVFSTPTGSVLETANTCSALPGRVSAVAVLADGWLVLDPLKPPYGLQPFGVRPRVGAELWLGIDTTVNPLGTLCLAVDLLAPPGRASAESSATVDPAASPMLRWEAMATHGPAELALDFDGTRGLQRGGVVGFRVPDLDWAPRLRPGQATGTSYRWLRARLVTASYPTATRLAGMVLNGVTAGAARSVRGEVAEAVDRSASGSRYRLATVPVVPGSVELEITGSAAGLGVADPTGSWAEVPTLSTAQPDDQVFVLDPASGVLTFGDGLHGRSVPEGYRNVVSLVYRTGGGTTGHAATGDLVPPEVSIPDLTGLRVVSISTGSDAEDATGLLRRGPAVIRSRERAVAATDYAVAALGTPGAAIARAHCLPAVDSTGTPSPGALGLVVVPRLAIGSPGPPVPDVPTLQLVADHLALEAGVVGAHVLALAPRYRRVAVQCLLVGALGADLAGLVSTARDRLDAWLDPLVGGDGAGWEFGAPVQWNDVVRMLLARVPRLEAVSQVSFRVDGRALPACTDVVLAPGELVWPSTHLLEVAPEVRGGAA